jgi:phosphatidylethanolamine-binding protein (PEBP) family uncharacterized protein
MDMSAPGSERIFDWAVAGLHPRLRTLAAGSLPRDAVVGRNSFGQTGYDVCPAKGQVDDYFIILYALPHRLSLKSGFDPNQVYEDIARAGFPEGQSGFAYKRTL